MKTKKGMRGGFTLVELLVVISIIATLAGVGIPVIMSKVKDGNKAQAIGNIKQIGLAMFTFEQEYNSYPCDSTGQEVKLNNPDVAFSFGNTFSNDFFRQLIAAGSIDQEKPFFAKAPYTKTPDNVMSQGKCLDAGECGFAYIMATNSEPLSSTGNTARPLIAAAVYNCQTNGAFDPDVYGKFAVIFRIDNSATAEHVRPSDKKVLIGGGKTLLQGGDKDTVWGNDINPVIKPPQKAHVGGTSQLPGTNPDDSNH